KRVAGIRITLAKRKFAAIAADSSYFANHLPISVAPSAEHSGTGMAYTQEPCARLSASSLRVGCAPSRIWLHGTAIAPTKAPAKQPKKTAGETGIGTFEMKSATPAAQKGVRLRIAEMMTGWALLRPALYKSRPLIPIAKMTASLPRFEASVIKAKKSRRLAGRDVSSGMEINSASWVRQTNCKALSRLAARKENGSWVAKRTAVSKA